MASSITVFMKETVSGSVKLVNTKRKGPLLRADPSLLESLVRAYGTVAVVFPVVGAATQVGALGVVIRKS